MRVFRYLYRKQYTRNFNVKKLLNVKYVYESEYYFLSKVLYCNTFMGLGKRIPAGF
jgi:hypothetical protein